MLPREKGVTTELDITGQPLTTPFYIRPTDPLNEGCTFMSSHSLGGGSKHHNHLSAPTINSNGPSPRESSGGERAALDITINCVVSTDNSKRAALSPPVANCDPFFLASAPAPRFTQVLLSAFLERAEVWANPPRAYFFLPKPRSSTSYSPGI